MTKANGRGSPEEPLIILWSQFQVLLGIGRHPTQFAAFIFAAVAAIASAVAAASAVFAILQARGTSRELSSIRDSLNSMLGRMELMAITLGEAAERRIARFVWPRRV